jgi:asparagine synthase (glutamine-hydrolysing)
MFGAMSGGQAPFRDVHPVPANSWVQWDQAMRRTQGTGWAGLFDDLGRATTQQLRDEFLQSISLHLLSDVPVGLLLSSGLDSAAIAWACMELGKSLVCITADMGDAMAEGPASRHVATRFGHRHEIVSAVPDSDIVQRYFAAMQKPSIDGLNTFLVSKAVADLGLKVALSGLGADEMLAGYTPFRRVRYLSLLRFADVMHANRPLARLYHGRNEKLARLLDSAGPRDAVAFAALCRRVLMDDQVEALVPGAAPVAPVVSGSRDTSARALSLAEIDGYLRGTLLPDTDTFSMAWSVEMRVPYVDAPFTRIALAVDPRRGVGKQRFAAALGDTELRKIAERRKRGFTLPMDSWMRSGPLLPYVQAVRSADAPVREVLDVGAIDHLMARWSDGMVSWPRAWSIVSLNAWLRTLNVDGVHLDRTPEANAGAGNLAC